jgi:lipopolysaccharide assembly protein A
MQRGLMTGITLGVAMVIFTLQNPVKVPVRLLWIKFTDVPLALVLVIAFLVGASIIAVFAFIDKQRLRTRIKRLRNRIKENENQLFDENGRKEAVELTSDDGMTIEGDPGHKFFD